MECSVCGKPLDDQSAYCAACGVRNELVEEYDEYVYEAFISYRHLPTDKTVARRVQRALEGFRIPKRLRASEDAVETREGSASANPQGGVRDSATDPVQSRTNPKRLGKLFRDEDELPASDSLPGQIEHALKQSRFLIVVCTPQTRESLWVMKEVELFAAYHGRHRIMVALAEGEPSESFPPLLLTQSVRMPDGSVTEMPAEPLAADLRGAMHKRFSSEILRLAAPLIGCGYDDLRQRQRAATVRNALLLAAVISVVSLTFGIVSYRQQLQIQENYRQMQMRESEVLAQRSAQLLAQGDRYEAIQVALAALPRDARSSDRPFVPAAQRALADALGIYPQKDEWKPCYSLQTCADQLAYRTNHAWFGGDGLCATLSPYGQVQVLETLSGDVLCTFDAVEQLGIELSSTTVQCSMAFAGERLVVVYRDGVGCFDIGDGTLLWSYKSETEHASFCPYDVSVVTSHDSKQVVFCAEPDASFESCLVYVVATEDGSLVQSFELENPKDKEDAEDDPVVVLDSDGNAAFVGCWGSVFKRELTTGKTTSTSLRFGNIDSMSLVDGRLAVISYSNQPWLNDNHIALDVLDASLAPLWDRSEPFFTDYDKQGIDYAAETGVIGMWDYYGNGSVQYVTLFGNKLLLLDAETGKEELAIECGTTFLGGAVLEARGRERIFACTSTGEVLCRVPYSSNNGRGGSAHDEQHDIGSLQEAVFSKHGDRVTLSVMSWTEDKRIVYRFTQNDDYPSDVPLSELAEIKSLLINDETVVVKTDTSLTYLDPSSLEVVRTVPTDRLFLDGRVDEITCSTQGNVYFAGTSTNKVDGLSAFSIFRVKNGEDKAEQLITLGGQLDSGSFAVVSDERGAERLVLSRYYNHAVQIVSLDPDNPRNGMIELNLKETLGAEDALSVYRALVVTAADKVAVMPKGDAATTSVYLLDAFSGELVIDSDLSHYEVSSDATDHQIASEPDASVLALYCTDGYVRMFDAGNGALLWESADPYTSVSLLSTTREQNVFLQDEHGSCFLLEGESGVAIRSTPEGLPRFTGAFQTKEGDVSFVIFRESGLMGRYGITLMSLDEDAFGPLSVIYGSLFASSDCQWFLYEDSYSSSPHRARLLSLDELLELAHATVEGHELTEAQRQLYGIAS